jgi:hypothetical protein
LNAHVDVAAYALGALSDRESSQFEDHLVQCSTCASELESMVRVVSLMSDVSLADIADDAPPVMGPYTAANGLPVMGTPNRPPAPSGPPMTSPVGAPVPAPFGDPTAVPVEGGRRDDRREERRPAAAAPVPPPVPISRGRSKRRRGGTVLLAAAAAVVGAVAGGAVVAETGYFDPPAQAPVQASDGEVVPITGEKVSATDKRTGAHIDAALDSKAWGTKVSFAVTKIEGPKSCRLVAVRKNGDTEVLSSWDVPDGGYGYEVRPQPLSLTAATAMRSKDITRLEVQAMDDSGDPSTLVTVRV